MHDKTDTTLRVGIYARISEDRDGQQTATERQFDDCRAFVARHNWEIADEFEDVDLSAYSTRVKRPDFERMLEALRSGEVDGVIVWKLDRLSRQQRDLVRVMEACEPHKAFIASVTEPIDTREPHGQFVAELLVAQGRMESANSSARQRRKALEQRKNGVPPSNGKRCFGYTRGYAAIVEDEAAFIGEARDRVLAGESLRSICFDWQRRGINSTQGNPWRTQILVRTLSSATLCGHREHEGTMYPGSWPAILRVEETLRLRALFGNRKRGPRSGTARKALLTGFIRCGSCGERMYASRRNDHVRRYICRMTPGTGGCGQMTTLAEPLEELVREMVVAAVDSEALAEALRSKESPDDGWLDEVLKDEEAREALANDYYVERLLSREEFLSSRAALTSRLEANRAKLAKRDGRGMLTTLAGGGAALRAAWEANGLDWRRGIVGALLDHVVLESATARGRQPFDPTRVKPVWRY